MLLRSDPPDGEAVWRLPEDQWARFHPRLLWTGLHLVAAMMLTATLGTITFPSASGAGITSFWPAAAFQVVFPIWFGIYGTVAGVVGPMFGNALMGSALAYVPANLIQSVLAAWWFRSRRLDPRLRTPRDWLGLVIVGCVVAHALGAVVGVGELWLRQAAARLDAVVRQHQASTARDVLSVVFQSIDDFAAGAPRADDTTVVALRRLS